MKKLLSAFLAFALLLSFVTPAFAYQGAKTADTAAQAEKAHDPATCTDCPRGHSQGNGYDGALYRQGHRK